MATGVISGVSTAVLEFYGYNSQACCEDPGERECDNQPESVETVLRFMFAMIAPILMIIAIIALRFYTLDDARHGEIKAELEKKRLALLGGNGSAELAAKAPATALATAPATAATTTTLSG